MSGDGKFDREMGVAARLTSGCGRSVGLLPCLSKGVYFIVKHVLSCEGERVKQSHYRPGQAHKFPGE
jgi:hypothetical protein